MFASTKPKRRRRDAAEWLTAQGYPIKTSTLERLATVGGGPPFTSFGRIPLYDENDLLAWARARCRVRASTSDPGRPIEAA